MFESLSDRLTGALQGLRGKGRLTDADVDATTREIRLALLEADVSLPVVRGAQHQHRGVDPPGSHPPNQRVDQRPALPRVRPAAHSSTRVHRAAH